MEFTGGWSPNDLKWLNLNIYNQNDRHSNNRQGDITYWCNNQFGRNNHPIDGYQSITAPADINVLIETL